MEELLFELSTKSPAQIAGGILGILFVCVWLPFGGIITQELVRAFTLSKPPKKPKPQIDPIPKRAKRPKRLCSLKSAIRVLGSEEVLKQKIKEGKIRAYTEYDELFLNSDDVIKCIPAPSKRGRSKKSSYPTISSFDEEHRITNPVEFGT